MASSYTYRKPHSHSHRPSLLPPIMVHPPSSPSFWRWWLKAVDTHTVHLSPSHRILQVPTDISASSTSPSPPLCPTAALSADAFNLIAVALLVLLLCRGVGVLRCVRICMALWVDRSVGWSVGRLG